VPFNQQLGLVGRTNRGTKIIIGIVMFIAIFGVASNLFSLEEIIQKRPSSSVCYLDWALSEQKCHSLGPFDAKPGCAFLVAIVRIKNNSNSTISLNPFFFGN